MNRPNQRAREDTMIWPEKRRNCMIQSEKPETNWLDLPSEILTMILMKLNVVEILTSVQHVCSSWYKICKQPHLWRVIDMHSFDYFQHMEKILEGMCMIAARRSRGQVVDIDIAFFGTDALLQFIARESNQLRRLSIATCKDISDKGLAEAVAKLPLLENLQLILCSIDVKTLKTIGYCCPILKTLELYDLWEGQRTGHRRDMEAVAIAETMPKLRHLQIISNSLTDRGLQAILDGCPDLESLNLINCCNLKFQGQLMQRCVQRIKTLYLPLDPALPLNL